MLWASMKGRCMLGVLALCAASVCRRPGSTAPTRRKTTNIQQLCSFLPTLHSTLHMQQKYSARTGKSRAATVRNHFFMASNYSQNVIGASGNIEEEPTVTQVCVLDCKDTDCLSNITHFPKFMEEKQICLHLFQKSVLHQLLSRFTVGIHSVSPDSSLKVFSVVTDIL